MSSNATTSRNTKVTKTNKSTVKDTQTASEQSTTNAAIVQCWTPSFARCHHDDENNLVEVSCRCKTCCSKSSGGNGLSFATVEYWLTGHDLNAWQDPLGSGFHVVAIKSCTEKFLEKVHEEEYAQGVRFWMNFEKGRFDVRQPRKEKVQSDASAAVELPAQIVQETASDPAPHRPFKSAPAVNPWGKGKKQNKTSEDTPIQEETVRLMSAPLPKEKKIPQGSPKTGKWKKVETELTPDSRHVVIVTESASSATQVHTARIAPFDLRLETPCKFSAQCRNKTHTETSKFVCRR